MTLNVWKVAGFISIIMMLFSGSVLANEEPVYLFYMQGAQSSITEGTNGTYALIVHDVIPYTSVRLSEADTRLLDSESLVGNITIPLSTAIVLGSPEDETTLLVQMQNMNYSKEANTLTADLVTQDYYDGSLLSDFAEVQDEKLIGEYALTRIFMEYDSPVPLNDNNKWADCLMCIYCLGLCRHCLSC